MKSKKLENFVAATSLLGLMVAPVAAQQAADTTPQAPVSVDGNVTPLTKEQPMRVEVTGSLIRSSDNTEFNQVQTITVADIKNSGAASVADYLRQISANSGSSYNESTVLNQSPGGTGIALRGMSVKYTLVLVDGQRATPYALASGGTDTFTDLNTIPLNMIDRIEVVKVGAVSQYGSDAIAGVVNIITRKGYQGIEVDGNLGAAQMGGQDTKNFSLLGGFGDMNNDGYNITSGVSYLSQSGVKMSQRPLTKDQDYSNRPGGFFAQPSSFIMTPTGPQALPDCGPNSHITSADNNIQTQMPGTVCSQNGADAQSLAARTERLAMKVHSDYRLNGDNEAFVDFWGSHNTSYLQSGLAGFGANALVPSLYYQPGKGFEAFAPKLDGNDLTYYFPKGQAVDTTGNFYRIATGLKGSFSTNGHGDWDWQTAYGHSVSNVSNAYSNQINAAVAQNYLNSVSLNTFNPNAFNNLAGLFGTSHVSAQSKLDTLDATISSPNAMKLPAGDVGAGFGVQLQHQSEYIGAGSIDYVNPVTQSVDGQRNAAAAFYQVDVPLLKDLQFSQSGRYDHYNDFGGVFSPRYALRYQPVSALTMYGSYSAGFRAPTLIELDELGSVTYQAVGNQNVNEYFEGNPNLKPERTKNYNLGFQMSPTRTIDFGLDYYKIEVSNVVTQEDIVAKVREHPGLPYYDLPYSNLSHLDTSGFELTYKQKFPTSIGKFVLASDIAYVWHFSIPGLIVPDFAGNNGANDTVFGGGLPRWKANTSLNWSQGNWNSNLAWQYTGSYRQVIDEGDTVPSYSTFNLTEAYTGIKNLTVYASVNNLFNRAPPYDPVWTYTYRGSFEPSLYDYIGRSAKVGLTYRF